jgi:predicted DCC family thiol-disulfide oxidoreductase YuxK
VIIYYDSHCALCHGAVQFILKVDRNSVFWFAPLSQLENRHQFNFPDSLVLEKNGKYYFEGKAILEILKKLRWQWRLLGKCLNLIPLVILDQAYRFIANNRKRWELKNGMPCPIVPVELRKRVEVM